MFRVLIIGLACLGLLTVYGFFNDSAKQELAHTGTYVNQAKDRLVAEVKAMDESPTSKEVAEWVKQVPGPSPDDLLQIRVLVDKLRADPQAASRTWAEWRQKYAELCKDKIDPHLPSNLQCGNLKP